jgi:hypothetical protein
VPALLRIFFTLYSSLIESQALRGSPGPPMIGAALVSDEWEFAVRVISLHSVYVERISAKPAVKPHG